MNLEFNDEQILLRNVLARFLYDNHNAENGNAILKLRKESGLWEKLSETLHILGASLPEEAGGMGGGHVETMIIMEEFGKALIIEPYIENAVISAGILNEIGGFPTSNILKQLIAGDIKATFAHSEMDARFSSEFVNTKANRNSQGWVLNGEKVVVVAAPSCDYFIVSARTDGTTCDLDGISLFIVDAATAGLSRHDYTLIDGRPASDVILKDVRVGPDSLLGIKGEAFPVINYALEKGVAALCAEAVGVMRRMLSDTVTYTQERKQFGSPLSKFQVLQHRMVDMYIAVERAAAATYLVTLKLEANSHERALAVAAAKATISNTIRFVAQNAVQLHGAMAMTDELAVGHYFRRATAIEYQFGSSNNHIDRYAKLMRET